MFDVVLKNPWVRAIIALTSLVGVAFLAWLLRPILVPLFFAFIVAYVFDPLVDRLEKFKISRIVSIAILALIGIGLALAGPLLLLPSVITEADHLIGVAQERMRPGPDGAVPAETLLNRLPLRGLVEALGLAPEGQADYDPVSVLVKEASERVRDGATNFLKDYGAQAAQFGKIGGTGVLGVFSSIGRAILGFVLSVGNIVLFAVVAGYLLRDFDGIIVTAKDLVPPRYRDRTFSIFSKIDGQLRSFMRGQALVCLALGVLYSIGLSLSGVPFAVALGIFGGAVSFVPYLGLILTILPASILCIVSHGGIDLHLAGVMATFVVAQMLEGTVITPKVVGEQVGLGPVWVILAVLVFGNALGFLGLLLAAPIAASLKVLVVEGVEYYRQSPVFAGETEASDPPEAAPARPKRRSTRRKSKSKR